MPPTKRIRGDAAAPVKASCRPDAGATRPSAAPGGGSPPDRAEDGASAAAHHPAAAAPAPAPPQMPFLFSKVVAPDAVGICGMAVDRTETRLLVARENGSFALYAVDYFQNIPHFSLLRHTGGQQHRTVARVAFLEAEEAASAPPRTGAYFLAAYRSGQVVVFATATLTPVSIYQRTGGAVWDCCVVGSTVYSAVADGSWHQLTIRMAPSAFGAGPAKAAVPTLELQHILPKVPGAQRALAVACSADLGLVVGADDAGNVVAFRLHSSACRTTSSRRSGGGGGHDTDDNGGDGEDRRVAEAARPAASEHASLWSSRLPQGMALCVAVCDARAAVAAGTSMGDVVILDAGHGHILRTFSQHKGPVTTVTSHAAAFFASGWHESLRSYRYSEAGREWYPAEVKRRTHYHEAAQVLVTSRHQLLLSAARDGTILYAPLATAFTSPAMYLHVTTQQFAFARERGVLLHTRGARIEAFQANAAFTGWTPLFCHTLPERFPIKGLWCDEHLRYVCFATDERVAVLKITWNTTTTTTTTTAADAGLALRSIRQVVELPAGTGVVDGVFATGAATGLSLYLLTSERLIHVALVAGYPTVTAPLPVLSRANAVLVTAALSKRRTGEAVVLKTVLDAAEEAEVRRGDGVFRRRHADDTAAGAPPGPADGQPTRLHAIDGRLYVVGMAAGTLVCATFPDGAPDASSFTWENVVVTNSAVVPCLGGGSSAPRAASLVGLCDGRRYHSALDTPQPQRMPETLPHDVTFLARWVPPAVAVGGGRVGDDQEALTLGVFSRGLLCATPRDWFMVRRLAVAAAFPLRDRRTVLVLERHVEAALEALPMCWKVRRFGN